MVQPRDFVAVQNVFFEDDGVVYVVLCSVPDDAKTPPVPGKTRGTITASGWRLRPNGNDTDVSYIVKGVRPVIKEKPRLIMTIVHSMTAVNPNGYLPSTIVNLIVQEIPNCVVNIIDWVRSEGFIPNVREPEDLQSILRVEIYTHSEAQKYQLSMICAGGEALEVSIDDNIKYKNGYIATVENDAKQHVSHTEERGVLKVRFTPEAEGKKVDIIVTAESSKSA
jgi:hypothetical protein